MKLPVEFFCETEERWPSRNGRAAGRAYSVYVIDRTPEPECRLRDMYLYRLSEEEEQMYKGKLQGHYGVLAVHQVLQGVVNPVFRGRIMEVRDS